MPGKCLTVPSMPPSSIPCRKAVADRETASGVEPYWRPQRPIGSLALPISAAWLYMPLLPAGVVTLLQALADLVVVLRGSSDPHAEAAV